jgi:hypothetical protein
VDLLVQVAGVLGELRRHAPVLARQVVAIERVLQDAADLLGVPRLGDVAVDLPERDGLDQDVDVGEGGQDDADRVGPQLLGLLQQLEAGHLRHALIGDDHRDVALAQHLERLGAAGRADDVEHLPEVEAEGVQVVLLVIDDQDRVLLGVEGLGHWFGHTTGGPELSTATTGRVTPVRARHRSA